MIPLSVPPLTAASRHALLRAIRLDWQEDAACTATVQTAPELFYPDPPDAHGVARAAAICVMCPVRSSCLAAALVLDERHGVWGGAGPADRDRILVDLSFGESIERALSNQLDVHASGRRVPDVLRRRAV